MLIFKEIKNTRTLYEREYNIHDCWFMIDEQVGIA